MDLCRKLMSLLFNMLSTFVIAFFPKEQASFNFMAAVTICSNFGRAPSAHPVQLLIPKSYQIRQVTLFPQVSERLKQGQGCYSSNTPSSGQKYGGRQCLQPLQHAQGVYPLRHCTSLLTRAVGLFLEERDVTVRMRDPFIPSTLCQILLVPLTPEGSKLGRAIHQWSPHLLLPQLPTSLTLSLQDDFSGHAI